MNGLGFPALVSDIFGHFIDCVVYSDSILMMSCYI